MGLQAGSGFVKTAGEWVLGRLVVPKAVHQNDRECLLKTDIPRLHQTDQLLLFRRHCVRLSATPWLQHARPPCPSPAPGASLKLMSIESVMPSSQLILCRPLPLPPSIFASIRVFSSESALRVRWPKYWCFSFSISPSSDYSGLISSRMAWLDLLAVHGTLLWDRSLYFKEGTIRGSCSEVWHILSSGLGSLHLVNLSSAP